MASHEYAHCDNCIRFHKPNSEGIGECSSELVKADKTNKKGWCGDHFDKDPLNANIISVEYTLRRDHILLELQHGKDRVKPVEELLKSFGWDGVERIKMGKWPEDKEKVNAI
mgnify:CR=1 FL=1